MNEISAINNFQTTGKAGQAQSKTGAQGASFSDRLKTAMKDTNTRQHVADESIEKVIQGKMGVHEGMLKLQEAEISLKLFMKVRNKAVDAYKEIIRMPV
jgi:flagellar hook-basal body complex protein FliE